MADITYDQDENAIFIEDRQPHYLKWNKISLLISLLFFSAKIYDQRDAPYEFVNYLYLAGGVAVLFALIHAMLRATAENRIEVTRIKRLRTRRILGNKRYSLLLSDGKVRDIPSVDTQVDRNKLHRIADEAGIPHD